MLSSQLSPAIIAFGRAVEEWWAEFLAGTDERTRARQVLITRLDAMMALDQDVRVHVRRDSIEVRGVAILVDHGAGRRLAAHLHALSLRRMTFQPGISAREFVVFLKQCANEPAGRGLGDYLTQAIPQHLLVDVEEVDLPPVPPLAALQALPAFRQPRRAPEEPAAPAAASAPLRVAVSALEDMFQRMRGDDTEELQGQVVEEVFELVMAVANRGDRIESEQVAQALAVEGRRLVNEAKLGTWIRFLSQLHRKVVVEHRLGATLICQQILDFLGSEEHVGPILRQFDAEDTPGLDLLVTYVSLVPSRALLTVCRQDHWFASNDMRMIVLNYLCEAGSSNPEGLVALARDPDPSFADLVVEVLPSLPGSVAPRALKACLEHKNPRVRLDAVEAGRCVSAKALVECMPPMVKDESADVRMEAARCLAEFGTVESVAPLIKEVKARSFRNRTPEEQVAFWAALARSGRPEALYTVEEALHPPQPRSTTGRLLAKWRGQPLDMPRRMLVRELALLDRPQIREILRRGMRSGHRGLARACKRALEEPRVAEE